MLMDKDERYKLLKKLYSKDGMGFGIGRLTVGSSDYSAEVYTYDDVEEDTELKFFSIERDREYIIPIIKEIIYIKQIIRRMFRYCFIINSNNKYRLVLIMNIGYTVVIVSSF